MRTAHRRTMRMQLRWFPEGSALCQEPGARAEGAHPPAGVEPRHPVSAVGLDGKSFEGNGWLPRFCCLTSNFGLSFRCFGGPYHSNVDS